MNKSEYLNDHNVSGFVKYLACLIKYDKNFPHSYTIKKGGKNAAWIRHNKGQEWSCSSLENACEQYFWLNDDFQNNNRALTNLSNELKRAVERGEERNALCVSMQILEWGGVTNGAYGPANAYCNNRLIKSLNEALVALTPHDNARLNLSGFESKKDALIMNASYTKIYSLLSDQPFIIYDSRVAAALSLIVKSYWLETREGYTIHQNKGLPEFLSLACLDGRGNNSARCADNKDNNIFFSKANNNDKTHALWNVRANWIVEAALKHAGIPEGELIQKMREVEAALFMIGYSV